MASSTDWKPGALRCPNCGMAATKLEGIAWEGRDGTWHTQDVCRWCYDKLCPRPAPPSR